MLETIIKFKKLIFLVITIFIVSLIYQEAIKLLNIKNKCNFTEITFNTLINYYYPVFYNDMNKVISIYFLLITLFLFKLIQNKIIKIASNFFISIILIIIICLHFIIIEDRPKVSSVKANMHTFQTILETYAFYNNGIYPKNIKKLKEEAIKKEYWKEVKNPFEGYNNTFLDISFFNNKIDCLYLQKENEVSFEAGVVIYNPIINKEQKINKYYLYGTYLLNNKSKLIEDKGKFFYLTNQ
ncbi:MAG: hypothetical protein ACK4IX_10460 [Candidatus Sericytochromatia bacterium]